jgi:hypothetical protein
MNFIEQVQPSRFDFFRTDSVKLRHKMRKQNNQINLQKNKNLNSKYTLDRMTFSFSDEESMGTISSTSISDNSISSSTERDNISNSNTIDSSINLSTTGIINYSRRRQRPSILVLGASSRTGIECIEQLSQHPSKPYIHAFYEEDMPVLDDEHMKLCDTIMEGSMRHAIDIEEALITTGAEWIVLCNNSSDNKNQKSRPKDHSTVSAKNIVHVLEQKQFASVRVLIISRIEAVTTKRTLLSVRCKLLAMKSRPVLQDLAGQEKQMHSIWDRTTIVRTSRLADSPNNSTRRLIEMSDDEAVKSLNCSFTERVDLASYIVEEVCIRQIPSGNRVINVISAKM